MSEGANGKDAPRVARAVVVRKKGISLVWLIPLVAAVLGVYLVHRAIMERGPEVTITFQNAEGLVADKTKVKYRNVEVGVVQSIDLSDDIGHVEVKVRFVPGAGRYLTDKTQLWVVRPMLSMGQVSGLSTLFSGAYIGIDPDPSGTRTKKFEGLEEPPAFTSDVPGTMFHLRAENLGSADVGAPVFFRRIPVGRVTDWELDQAGDHTRVDVFVRAPHDERVRQSTRFWNASGIDASLGPNGLELDTVSLAAILIGGLAFDTPAGPGSDAKPDPGHVFTLYPNKRASAKPEFTAETIPFRMYFSQKAGGLAKGSPVRYQGIVIGQVTDVHLEFDLETGLPRIPVTIAIQPQRIREERPDPQSVKERWDGLVAKGLRAQLASANLLTGQLAVDLDFFPVATEASIEWDEPVPVLPTVPSPIQTLVADVGKFVDQMNRLPLDQIGADLRETVAHLNELLVNLEGVTPSLIATLEKAETILASANELIAPDSSIAIELQRTLQELAEAARSLRILADQLERNPESLLRGKRGK